MGENNMEIIEVETGPEKIEEEQKGFATKLFSRLIGAKEFLADKIEKADKESLWVDLREMPETKGVIVAIEALVGARPGNKLDTKGALLQALSATVILSDNLDKRDKKKEKSRVSNILDRAEQNTSEDGKPRRFFSACRNFFNKNPKYTEAVDATLENLAKYSE